MNPLLRRLKALEAAAPRQSAAERGRIVLPDNGRDGVLAPLAERIGRTVVVLDAAEMAEHRAGRLPLG